MSVVCVRPGFSRLTSILQFFLFDGIYHRLEVVISLSRNKMAALCLHDQFQKHDPYSIS